MDIRRFASFEQLEDGRILEAIELDPVDENRVICTVYRNRSQWRGGAKGGGDHCVSVPAADLLTCKRVD